MEEKGGSSIHLDVTPPSEAAGWIETGSMPAGDIRLLVEEPPKESDRPYSECSLLGTALKEMASGIEAILDGNRVSIELDATYVRFTPHADDENVEVRLEIMGVPDDSREYEPDVVDRTEFYETIRTWCDEALAVNPDLADAEWFREIEDELTNAGTALDNAGIETTDETRRRS